MIEKRSFKIKSKIITPADIRRIANMFHDIYSEYVVSLQKDNPKLEYRHKFEVLTTDGTEYSTDTLDIFKSDGILDSKTVQGISMSFRIYESNAEMSIRLTDSRYDGWLNHIEVEGSDSTWVNGTYNRLLECVNSWENQSSIGKGYKWPISMVTVILIGFFVVALIDFVMSIYSHGESRLHPGSYLFSLSGVGFIWFIAEYIEKLWPNIEIVSGPDHLQPFSKKRKRIIFVLAAIVMPLILGVLGNIIANTITK